MIQATVAIAKFSVSFLNGAKKIKRSSDYRETAKYLSRDRKLIKTIQP